MKRVWIAISVALLAMLGLVVAVAGQDDGALGFQPFTINVTHEEPVMVVSTATTEAGEVVTVTTPITIGVNLQVDVTGPSVAVVTSEGATASGVELVIAEPQVAPAATGVDGFVDTGDRIYTVDTPESIELGQVQAKGNSLGMTEVFGTLTNVGDSTLQFVQVSGQFYDEAGVLLGVGYGYADLEEFEPGQSSQFQMILTDIEIDDVAGYSLQVQE